MFFSIDLDAFYCGVEERIDPSLRGTAFCVVQKHCVATLSYPARALGIKKLSNVHDVLAKHPQIRIVNGENLAKYRQAGRKIFEFVQKIIGQRPVERLGLEELRFDLTDLILAWRQKLPDARDLKSWLNDDEFMDEVGGSGTSLMIGTESINFPDFYFQFDGATWPPNHNELSSALALTSDLGALLNAYLAGHLAVYIRDRVWLDLGYSCSIGCGTSVSLAKMVGNCHKPRGVTVLVPGHEPTFVAGQPIAKVPGFGRACQAAVSPLLGSSTVAELLDVYPPPELANLLTPLLGFDRSERLVSLLRGEDAHGKTIINYTCPQQISVEDSYASFCPESAWPLEIQRLCAEVLEQTVIDWFDDADRQWKVVPKTVRVSCVFASREYVRKSRSQSLAWPLTDPPPAIVATLARVALPLLHSVVSANQARPRVINVALLAQ